MISALIILSLTCLQISAQIKPNPWENLTVTIAVVEYAPVMSFEQTPQQRIQGNADNYIKILDAITDPTLNLIVYPEATLNYGNINADMRNTAVEIEIGENPGLITSQHEYIRTISRAAAARKVYIAINTIEKTNECDDTSENCRAYGSAFYNTDLVFDDSGVVIAKYRKHNLFAEALLDVPKAEIVTFTTNFGKFGIFTCFDILFKSPAHDAATGEHLDGFLFPAKWYSELPFMTALQVQQMWAHEHNVKLFAAGASAPLVGSGGSGFYIGDQGPMNYEIVMDSKWKSFIYKYIQLYPNYKVQAAIVEEDTDVVAKRLDKFYLMSDISLKNFTTTPINLTTPQLSTTLCHTTFCCSFNTTITLKATTAPFYTYHYAAYAGKRSYSGYYNSGIEVCGIIACLNASTSSCGQRFPNYSEITWPLTFEELTIKAQFIKDANHTQFPNSVLSSLKPLKVDDTHWEKTETDKNVERIFKLKKAQNRLLTFAIYGRDFSLDGLPGKTNGAQDLSFMASSALLVVILIATVFEA